MVPPPREKEVEEKQLEKQEEKQGGGREVVMPGQRMMEGVHGHVGMFGVLRRMVPGVGVEEGRHLDAGDTERVLMRTCVWKGGRPCGEQAGASSGSGSGMPALSGRDLRAPVK